MKPISNKRGEVDWYWIDIVWCSTSYAHGNTMLAIGGVFHEVARRRRVVHLKRGIIQALSTRIYEVDIEREPSNFR